jgi:hypothetical protein
MCNGLGGYPGSPENDCCVVACCYGEGVVAQNTCFSQGTSGSACEPDNDIGPRLGQAVSDQCGNVLLQRCKTAAESSADDLSHWEDWCRWVAKHLSYLNRSCWSEEHETPKHKGNWCENHFGEPFWARGVH